MPAICRRHPHGAPKLPKFWHAGRCCGAGVQLHNTWAACGHTLALGPKQAQCCKAAERCWRLVRAEALQHCQHVMAGMCAGAMAPLGSSELPGQVVALVRGKLSAAPALRTKWALLARDLLALLTGLRTGVMLDYAAVQPAVLLELVEGITQLAATGALRAAYTSRCLGPPLQRRPCHSSEVMRGFPCRMLLSQCSGASQTCWQTRSLRQQCCPAQSAG